MNDEIKIGRKILDAFNERNKGIDKDALNERANQMHKFVIQWTQPDDMICLAAMSEFGQVLDVVFSCEHHKEEGEKFLNEMLNAVLGLYALAEERMKADLERLEREKKSKGG